GAASARGRAWAHYMGSGFRVPGSGFEVNPEPLRTMHPAAWTTNRVLLCRLQPDFVDDHDQVRVVEGLVLVAARDHAAVDLIQLDARQRDAQRLAPVLHG